MTMPTAAIRPIRSFVRREGRMTPAQEAALATLWPVFGLELSGKVLDLNEVFGRDAEKTLEIGFGAGDALIEMAATQPERDFIGIEVHRPGVGRVLRELESRQLTNVRLFCADATQVLAQAIADGAFSNVLLFFPDPWPKKRHQKRRIVQQPFVSQVRQKLADGGRFHLATDWENYAAHMLVEMEAAPGFANLMGANNFCPRPDYRPITKFERRGERLGHGIWDLIYVKG